MKQLPNFQCGTCGQCETDYYQNRHVEATAGFCHKFKEVTTLIEKNVKCWTEKEIDFASVFNTEERRKKANDFKNDALAKRKGILQTNNQLNLF